MNHPLDNLENFLSNWINELTLTHNDGVYNGPTCPYAKKARTKVVKVHNYTNVYDFWSVVSAECNGFNSSLDVVAVSAASNQRIINPQQMSGSIDALNSLLNTQNKDLWLLSSIDETYTICIIQRITDLDNEGKVLEEKGYYTKRYSDYVFNKNVLLRRKLRENLK
tara:strand:- start:3862 stop:4359 length:498 start_codon:yes stop_codon:yes gene_type:complete